MPLDETFEGVMVRDHAGNLDIEFLRLPTREQIIQAVFLLADHDDDALLDGRIADFPVHLHVFGNRPEALAEFRQMEGQRIGLDFNAHEVAAAFRRIIRVVARLEDPAPMLGDEPGDAGNDADAVGTGSGKSVETLRMHGNQRRAKA